MDAAQPEPAPFPPRACRDCGAEGVDRFCPRCGQSTLDLHTPLRELAGEALSEALSVDSRMARTAVPFLSRPGKLTAEYLAGRRTRYSSPLRLYLFTSLVFFLASALRPDAASDAAGGAGRADGAEVALHAEQREAADRLRRHGFLGRQVAGRLDVLSRLPRDEVSARLRVAFAENVPRVAFCLVPAAAALLALLYRRAGRYYAEHLVFALHAQAFGFTALLPAAVTVSDMVLWAGIAAIVVHVWLALRRVYGGTRGGTALRLAAFAAGYLFALALGLGVAGLVAFYRL